MMVAGGEVANDVAFSYAYDEHRGVAWVSIINKEALKEATNRIHDKQSQWR